MILFQKIVNQKLNNISVDELLQYANQFNVTITREQAKKVVTLLNGQNINIFNPNERKHLLSQIAQVTTPNVAKQVNEIFNKFTR
ncbi:DUF2624 domain-containing protein [Metabacillus malikii]|nr:DUF2624 domain-containing protein [Metabacillus malikii]